MKNTVELLLIALRRLWRSPAVTGTAVFTLALGIGFSAAVFTVAKAVLIRHLPVADQDRVVLAWGATRDGRFPNVPLSIDDIRAVRENSPVVANVGFFPFRGATTVPLRYQDRVFAGQLAMVSGNYFELLGSRAVLGRTLRSEDDLPGASPVAVLSYRSWQQQFGGDSTVVGRPITIVQTGRRQTVIGVMPPALDYPRGTDVWVPLAAYSTAGGFYSVVTRELDMIIRLHPGASHAMARAELTRFFSRPGATGMTRNATGVIRPFADEILGDTRPALIVIAVAAALLLLIACVNVANLLLMGALDRTREIGIAAALGASRRRIAGEWMVETSLLSIGSGVLGMVVAVIAVRAFVLIGIPMTRQIDQTAATREMLAWAVGATVIAMLSTAVPPTLFAARIDVTRLMQSGTRSTRTPRLRRLMNALVVTQLALAVISLAAAGLVTNSLIRLMRADLSFQTEGLLVAPLAITTELPSSEKARAALIEVIARLRALPGVRSATLSFSKPFIGGGGGIDGTVDVPGQAARQHEPKLIANLEIAGPDYFATFGIPVIGGRAFTAADHERSSGVTVVSAAVANHFWPGRSAIGKQLRAADNMLTVIGVVADARVRDLRADRPTVYFPMGPGPFGDALPTTLLVRASQPADALLPSLRRVLADVSSGLSLVSLTSVEAMLDGPRESARLNSVVLGFFAMAALFLASLGVFAIMATMVRRRTHEFGIRMALGASAADVQRLVLAQAARFAVLGAILGVLAALAMNRSLEALLFQVSAADVPTLLSVSLATMLVAVGAAYVPARAGAKVEPLIALRDG